MASLAAPATCRPPPQAPPAGLRRRAGARPAPRAAQTPHRRGTSLARGHCWMGPTCRGDDRRDERGE
jgi:hypothetical protein